MTTAMTAPASRTKDTTLRRRRRPSLGFIIVGGLLVIVVLAVIFAPLLTPYSPTEVTDAILAPPSLAHPFGTDNLGHDVFSRTLYGGRNSLLTAALSVVLATAAGLVLGLVAGYGPRGVSAVIMRMMDVVLGFPALLLALLILAAVGAGLLPTSVAVAIGFLPIFTRVVYSSTMRAREEGYVIAARVVGVRAITIVRRHVTPAVRNEVLVIMTSAVGWSILLDSALSFLGLGAQPPNPDWGADLNNGQGYLQNGWWMSVAPGLAITLTVLLVNMLGDLLTTETGVAKMQEEGK